MWISSRTARKRGRLRVVACERGRGSPTSTSPTTRPGARGEHEHAIGEVDGLVDVVRHVHDRHASVPEAVVDAEQDVLELCSGERVDRRERLVEQEQLGPRREGARDRDALLHPAGELPGVLALDAGEAQLGE